MQSKMLIQICRYLFLVERAHALRAPFICRARDWLWVTGMALILSGFGGIGIVAFVHPVADISPIDGRCRMGIPRYVTIPLVLYDVGITVLLTLTFNYLLSPLIRSDTVLGKAFPATRLAECCNSVCRRSKGGAGILSSNGGNPHVAERLEKLLWKTFIGSVLVMIPTVGNFAALSALNGRQLGWVCLTICTFDGAIACTHAAPNLLMLITSGLDGYCHSLVDHRCTRNRGKTSKRVSQVCPVNHPDKFMLHVEAVTVLIGLFSNRRFYQPPDPSLGRDNTAKTNRMAQLDLSSTLSLDDVLSTEAYKHIQHERGQRVCPAKVQATTPSSQQSDPCLDVVNVMDGGPDSCRATHPRSHSLALSNTATSLNPPPRRWSATAGLFFSRREPCPIVHDWDLFDQSTSSPSFRVGRS